MKKKFINGILMAALMFAATSSFVSCKDNIDDELPPIYNALAQRSSELQDKIDSLKKVIDEIEPTIYNITNHYDTTINNIYNYIDTTVTTILSEDRARINAVESMAVDVSSYAHTNITNFGNRLDGSLNQFNNTQQTLITNWDERDVVIARALSQHDASILNLISRVTALENR